MLETFLPALHEAPATFLLTLREVLEAVLVAGVALTFLGKVARPELKKYVWAGVASGAAVAFTTGILLQKTLGGLPAGVEQMWEGGLMWLAAGLITGLLAWMVRQENASKQLENQIRAHVTRGGVVGLWAVAFLAVLREGVELAIFLAAAGPQTAGGQLLGFLAGTAVAITAGWLTFAGLARTQLRTFFTVSNTLLVLFAAGLTAHGVHELQEIGWLPFGLTEAFNLQNVLSDKTVFGSLLRALFGYNDNPSWLELTAYLAYLLAATAWLRRARHAKKAATAVATAHA